MRQNRLFQCPEPLDGSEQFLTAIFCVPDTPSWRRTITALISLLGYGRSWDEKTGDVTATQAVGQEIFETMIMCDLETHLAAIAVNSERIASALDGGAERYSITDIISSLEAIDTGLDILDYLDVLNFFKELISHFPSLDFKLSLMDIVQFAANWRITSSHLNYEEDIALSLRGVNLAAGGVPMQAIYENLGDGFNALAAGFTGGQSAAIQFLMQVVRGKDIGIGEDIIEAIEALLLGSIRDATYDLGDDIGDVGDDIEALTAALAALELGVENNVSVEPAVNNFAPVTNVSAYPQISNTINVESSGSCPECGGAGCQNCREGGVVETVPSLEPDDCEPPVGFGSWSIYDNYKCRAANRIFDDLLAFIDELGTVYSWFKSNHGPGGVYLNAIEVFNRIGNFLPESMPNPIEYTLSPAEIATIKTALTDRYMNFHRQNQNDLWDLFNQNLHLFYGLYPLLVAAMRENQDTIVQSLYDAPGSVAAYQYLENWIDDAIDIIAPNGDEYVGIIASKDVIKTALTNGFVNILFFPSSFGLYNPTIACTGNQQCCVELWLTEGSYDGTVYHSVFAGVYHQIAGYINVDAESYAAACGAPLEPVISNDVGYTALGTGDSFRIYDDDQSVDRETDELQPAGNVSCGRFFRIRSLTEFSAEIVPLTTCI